MTIDIDAALKRLSESPLHPGLDGLEDRVLAGIHARAADPSGGLRLMAVAAVGAILLGAASTRPSTSAQPGISMAAFGSSIPLAPSTLLATDR